VAFQRWHELFQRWREPADTLSVSGNRQVAFSSSGARRRAPVDLRAGSLTAHEPSQAQVFRNATVAGLNIGAGVGLVLFGSLILLHTMASPTVPLPSKALIVAVSLPVPLFLILRLARGGVVCDHSGIIIRNPIRHVRVKWEEIDHFEQQPATVLTNTAWACKVDGSSIRIYGLVTSMTRSAELEAPTLIDALNRRIAIQRSG
jgi:hypothetical protein